MYILDRVRSAMSLGGSRVALLVMALALGHAAPASAVLSTFVGSGNDCSGGSFQSCTATVTGTGHSGTGSPTIYKFGPDGTDFGNFASVTGSEFSITYTGATNVLSFTYTPGAGDPEIHYFDIKQANGYVLFYDLTNPITTATIDLDDYFPNNPGYSHITFFDTGSTPGGCIPGVTPGGCGGGIDPQPNPVPEPMSLALLGAGLLGLGVARRRRG